MQKRREEACAEQGINLEHTSYADIMQRLVRRYLFKMECEKLKDGARRCSQRWFSQRYSYPYVDSPTSSFASPRAEKKEGGAAVVAGGGMLYHPEDMYETQLPLVPESPHMRGERKERGSGGGGLLSGSTTTGSKSGDKLAARFADDEAGGVSFQNSRRPSAETVASGDSEKERGPHSGSGAGDAHVMRQRGIARRLRDRRRGSIFPGSSFAGQGNMGPMMPQQPLVPQVLQIPQLDAVQRTQKILDMRLQHLQLQTEQINHTSGTILVRVVFDFTEYSYSFSAHE